ncbi:MAG: sodium bicarbonate transporter family protein [Myxococcota bacterium]
MNLDDGLTRTGRPFGGLVDDVRRRLPLYASDFRDGLHPKVAASALFLYFACLANAIAFGALTGVVTHGQIGTVEMVLATAGGGILFALAAGQPLTILGGTGPIVIFTGLLYTACQQVGLPFLPVYAWVGIWSGLILFVLAATDASTLMRYFTRFTDEIFAALIAVIFIIEAVRSVSESFEGAGEIAIDARALMTLILALGTYLLSRTLKAFSDTPYLRARIREMISDFGPAIAITGMTLFAVAMPELHLEAAAMPEKLGTTTGRDWLVPLFDLPVWAILACSGPAALATILLFLDQNITTRLVNSPRHALRKGPGFHLDLAVVAVITAGCSVFGLPWIVAATVHALNHVRSLATTEKNGSGTHVGERIVGVRENRVSPLVIHIGIAASILMLPLISRIPMAVLFGLFLYMGFATLGGNEFWERLRLWVTDPNLYPASHYVSRVPRSVIHRFTSIQAGALALLWVLKTSALGILFPVLIAGLVPLRLSMNRFFDPAHLAALDGEEEAFETLERGSDVHA